MTYKHLPEYYQHIPDLYEDLTTFYQVYEAYLQEESFSNKTELERQGYRLFFTIKHRKLDGLISGNKAEELIEYLEGFYRD